MERRITKKIEAYQVDFKNAIKDWLVNENINLTNNNGLDKTSEFLQFVYDYNGIGITKEDFQKRKRVKNQVPQYERCVAKKAEGEQCTRRKKDETFCGTHVKGTPHGIISTENVENALPVTKVEVWVQEIKGIHCYIDASENVYYAEDIMARKPNPRIVAKYGIDEKGIYFLKYQIPVEIH